MSVKFVELQDPEVQVKIRKSSRAKRLSIKINPSDGVHLVVPRRCSYNSACEFLNEHTGWIKKQLVKINELKCKFLAVPSENEKKATRHKIVERVEYLAERYGFVYNRVFVRSQKTRWGSCSEKNNINLNYKLLQIDGELMDYVILHELVHTRIKNHSRKFWSELDKYTDKRSKYLDKQLRNYWL